MKKAFKMKPATLRFCTLVAAGKEPMEAYAEAFPGKSERMLKSKPYVLLKRENVQKAIEAIRKKDVAALKMELKLTNVEGVQVMKEAGLARHEKRRILRSIATSRKARASDRIRAIQVDNEMTGDNAPVRVEGEITLHSIFSALRGTTGLPGPDEAIDVDAYDPQRAIGP